MLDWDKCINRKGNHAKKEEEASSSKQEIVDFTQPTNPDLDKIEEEKVQQGLFDG